MLSSLSFKIRKILENIPFEYPDENKAGKLVRAGLNVASITPYAGGFFDKASPFL